MPGGSAWARRRWRSRRRTITAVIARFGEARRFFVNLEPAPDAEGVLARSPTDLGLPASGAVPQWRPTIAAACAGQPTLAILDNLETPWDKDTAATEALLGRLAAIDGLRLSSPFAASRRNSRRRRSNAAGRRTASERRCARPVPAPCGDRISPPIRPCPTSSSALDGHPLSIELLAANAQGKPDLKGLAADWNHRRARLLRRGAGDDRQNEPARLARPFARRARSAERGASPDPADGACCRTACPTPTVARSSMMASRTREERGAAARLETARLANRPDGRWRLLAPIRETLLADVPPEAEDRARLVQHLPAARRRWGRMPEPTSGTKCARADRRSWQSRRDDRRRGEEARTAQTGLARL